MPPRIQKKRRFMRFAANQKAQYCLRQRYGSWQECTIHTISRKGVGIFLNKKLNVGSVIFLEITTPHEFAPLNIKGTLKWIKERDSVFTGGIEFTKELDEIQFRKIG